MKKVFKLLLVILTGFVFVSTLKVSADETPLPLVKMLEGAQIRTTGEQGLRFTAQLNGETEEHGFYLVYGQADLADLEDALANLVEGKAYVNYKEVFKVPVPGVSKGGEYSVVLTGIPDHGYEKALTVFPYAVELEQQEETLNEAETRSVYAVVLNMKEHGTEEEKFIANGILGGSEQLIYFNDFESGKNSSYAITNGKTTLGLSAGMEWTATGSGVLWQYNAGQDQNIGIAQGTNIARTHADGVTLISEELASVTRFIIDAKNYGTSSSSFAVYAKDDDDIDFVLIEELELGSNFKTFVLEIDKENVELKLVASGARVNFDNIRIYGNTHYDNRVKVQTVTFDLGEDGLFEALVKKGAVLQEPTYQPEEKEDHTFSWSGFTFGNAVEEDVVIVGNWKEIEQEPEPEQTELMIYDAYGGGGNANAIYTHDYVVLYNAGSESVDLDGYSIQYAAAGSNFTTQIVTLDGIINSESFYLIQLSSGGSVGDPLPFVPNKTGSINMAGANFKLALASKTTVISGLSDEYVVDFLGAGSANENEGSGAAPAGSNTNSVRRNNLVDTDDNSADFEAVEADLSYLEGHLDPIVMYTVTFNSNGGSDVDSQIVLEGEKATEPADPYLAEHEFKGWFVNLTDTNSFDFNTVLEDDLTLIAKWQEVIIDEYIDDAVIVYDFSEITGNENTEVTNLETIGGKFVDDLFDEVLSAAKVYFGNGYIKFGTTTLAGTLSLAFENDVLIETVVIYATGWLDTDKITINGEETELDTKINGYVITLEQATCLINITTDKRAKLYGIEFYGPEANVAEPVYYNVTFNYNDGETNNKVEPVLKGYNVDKPSDPINIGYKFEGWFEKLTDTEEFDFDTPIMSHVTLIAKWEESNEPQDYSWDFSGGKSTLEDMGWTQNGLGTDYAAGSPRLKFDHTGDYIISPEFTIQGFADVKIWYKNNSITADSGSKVEIFDQNNNKLLTFDDFVGNTQTGYIEFEIGGSVTKIKIMYTKAAGNLGVGSVEIKHNDKQDLTDQQKVDAAKADLEIIYSGSETAAGVKSDITLITSGLYGTTISWASNKSSVISNVGVVTRSEDNDIEVTITATITLNGVTDTKTFVLTVLKTEGELEYDEIIYTFNSNSWGATASLNEGTPTTENWTSGKAGYAAPAGRGIQITSGVSGANGTSKSFSNIVSIEITYSTNASSGAGIIVTKIGNTEVQTFTVTKPSSGGTTDKSAGIVVVDNLSGQINITVNCSANSIYIKSIKIKYSK